MWFKVTFISLSSYSVPALGNIKTSPFTHSSQGSHTHNCSWVGVPRSLTLLSDFTFTFHFHALEREMATHSSVLAWRIPGTGEPGGLPSMGSHRVWHDWSDLAAATAVFISIFMINELMSKLYLRDSYDVIMKCKQFTYFLCVKSTITSWALVYEMQILKENLRDSAEWVWGWK